MTGTLLHKQLFPFVPIENSCAMLSVQPTGICLPSEMLILEKTIDL